LQAEAHGWRGEYRGAERCALQAMSSLPKGGTRWYAAAREAALASGRLSNRAELVAVAQELSSLGNDDTAPPRQMIAMAQAGGQLLDAGLPDRAEPLLARIRAFEKRAADRDPAATAWVHAARATEALFVGDPAAYLERRLAAAEGFEEAGDRRNACV